VDLELRPLCSAGITRLPRSYGPLRHLERPDLALAGCRLRVTRPHRRGFPCCVGSPCAGMPPPIPRWDPWGVSRREGESPRVPRDDGLPRIATGSAPTSGCFGACMAFTDVAACLLAEPPRRPVVSKASTASSPPPPLR